MSDKLDPKTLRAVQEKINEWALMGRTADPNAPIADPKVIDVLDTLRTHQTGIAGMLAEAEARKPDLSLAAFVRAASESKLGEPMVWAVSSSLLGFQWRNEGGQRVTLHLPLDGSAEGRVLLTRGHVSCPESPAALAEALDKLGSK